MGAKLATCFALQGYSGDDDGVALFFLLSFLVECCLLDPQPASIGERGELAAISRAYNRGVFLFLLSLFSVCRENSVKKELAYLRRWVKEAALLLEP